MTFRWHTQGPGAQHTAINDDLPIDYKIQSVCVCVCAPACVWGRHSGSGGTLLHPSIPSTTPAPGDSNLSGGQDS